MADSFTKALPQTAPRFYKETKLCATAALCPPACGGICIRFYSDSFVSFVENLVHFVVKGKIEVVIKN